MNNTNGVESTTVGVIVGRFQSPWLHAEHKRIINNVCAHHNRVLMFLGVSPLKNTLNNPLGFNERKVLINHKYPNIEIHPIYDHPSDRIWSLTLDNEIKKLLHPRQSPLLYGGRDGFTSTYSGGFPTKIIAPTRYVSATEIREGIANYYPPNRDFCAGLVAASARRYPTAYQAVDIAVFNKIPICPIRKVKLLLGRKDTDDNYRFIGGFSDPNSPSLEEDVKREVLEETCLECDDIQYVGSAKVDDWRYRGEQDCIKTALFYAEVRPIQYTDYPVQYMDTISSVPVAIAQDDISEVRWVDFDLSSPYSDSHIIQTHKPLYKMLWSSFQLMSKG